MLYDCWRRIASRCPEETAILDLSAGRRWSFAQLAQTVENGSAPSGRVVFPQGVSSDFVLAVLRAWRGGQVVCPLEPGQTVPEISGELPRGIVHLKTTSATTGAPRLVAFRAEQLKADADNIVATMGLRPEWPNLGVISLAHSYGFSNLILPLLLHGIPLLLVGATLPESLRRAAQTAPALTLAAVPALWQTWHDTGAIPSHIRLAISAGAQLPLALEQRVFAEQGLKLHNFYGSSECGGIAYDSSDTPRQDAAYVGTPLSGVAVSVAEDGCLEVRSQAVAEAYWPEASPTLGHGVFRTSDVGEVTEDLIYLRGRAGDQINIAGRKVLPEAIECVLGQHPQVRACLAFGVPSSDTQRGDIIVACVARGTETAGESLKQFAIEKLPAWQVPREWWFVDGLEANGRGKLSRAEWRKRYLEITTPSPRSGPGTPA
jgi:acyl-CoA synthetase (AMP-forming)/AMP-acid ligase II